MDATGILLDWRRHVRRDILPTLHGHTATGLADFSFAAACAEHCHSNRLAVRIPTRAKPASQRRRFERLLANPRLRAETAFAALTAYGTATRAGTAITLILDETYTAGDLASMRIGLGHRRRALPLWARCYARTRQPKPMPRTIVRMLRRVARRLPPDCRVTLLVDRGLAWPTVLRECLELGWHFVARLQRDVRLRRPDGTEVAVRDLAPRPGCREIVRGCAFKKSGWIEGVVTAVWEAGSKEPWLLFSDAESSYRACRSYARRMWIEESFRDEKGAGLHLEASRVRRPARLARLLVVLALAMWLAMGLGDWVIKSGRRRDLDPHRGRRLSVFQLGLRWLHRMLLQRQYAVLRLPIRPP